MKKVLYITNIEVPYRTAFFNLLAQEVDLTVLYERRVSANRDQSWTKGEERHFHYEYLDGADTGNESSFSFSIIKRVRRGYDAVVIGCYNTPAQILAMATMRMCRIPFYINLDGEPFLGHGIKSLAKRCALKGSRGLFVAGNTAAINVEPAVKKGTKITAYNFSSFTQSDIDRISQLPLVERESYILVVGQYFDYKGLDVATEVARLMPEQRFVVVGTGNRSEAYIKATYPPANVEVIPFLDKNSLIEHYRRCRAFVLPSRQECWGLALVEAATCGAPVVSTWGAGAAVDMLGNTDYEQYLAQPGDVDSLKKTLGTCLGTDLTPYSHYLAKRAQQYTIEQNAKVFGNELNRL